ncbi:hypothetical protein QUF70_09000 [Desulfobacterales bacterium HSG17]|nr:hypothetical protein [Desulfobacterales bacterium HSG17]
MRCLNCSYEFNPLFVKNLSAQRVMVCESCYAIDGQKTPKPDLGWFKAGYAVFKAEMLMPGFFPPVDDFKAVHKWLSGFSMARAEIPGEITMESTLSQSEDYCSYIEDELLRILKLPLWIIIWPRIKNFIYSSLTHKPLD